MTVKFKTSLCIGPVNNIPHLGHCKWTRVFKVGNLVDFPKCDCIYTIGCSICTYNKSTSKPIMFLYLNSQEKEHVSHLDTPKLEVPLNIYTHRHISIYNIYIQTDRTVKEANKKSVCIVLTYFVGLLLVPITKDYISHLQRRQVSTMTSQITDYSQFVQ